MMAWRQRDYNLPLKTIKKAIFYNNGTFRKKLNISLDFNISIVPSGYSLPTKYAPQTKQCKKVA
jgi:hypothetical protein